MNRWMDGRMTENCPGKVNFCFLSAHSMTAMKWHDRVTLQEASCRTVIDECPINYTSGPLQCFI